jgi:hypothetical protein
MRVFAIYYGLIETCTEVDAEVARYYVSRLTQELPGTSLEFVIYILKGSFKCSVKHETRQHSASASAPSTISVDIATAGASDQRSADITSDIAIAVMVGLRPRR